MWGAAWFIVAHSKGGTFDGLTDARGEPATPADRRAGATAPVDRRWGARTRIVAARAGIAGPPTEVLADAADRRLAPARNRLDRTAQGPRSPRCRAGWSPHPNFWAVAVDYATGRQVAFGQSGSPPAHLPDAVAASSAVPGFYRTVTINGRSYIDDGVHSTSNLDVLRNERLDVVLALNPMASLPLPSPRTVAERLAFAMRKQAGRRISAEANRLRAAGIEVIFIQPTAHGLDVMGSELMSSRCRHEVVQTAVRTMTKHLHRTSLGARLAELPTGSPPVSRRSQTQPTWLGFSAAARDRWAGTRAA